MRRYNIPVPICPKCFASIHVGALDQCPACGYSLRRADRIFGRGQVEFPRVLDAAGALTRDQRREMLAFLERLERNISPVALGIYITDKGKPQDFCTLAHWILNHAHIHQPSFGKREKIRAVESSEIRVRRPGEPEEEAEPAPSRFRQLLHEVGGLFLDYFRPLPPSVRHEWMLLLVLDVQLEVACFSWGYMLDPYINPDRINTCIIKGQLSFRERELVSGLKTVMRAAVRQIASHSRAVTKKLRNKYDTWPVLIGGALALSLAAATAPAQAQEALPAPAAPQVLDEDVAVDPDAEDVAVDPDAEDVAVDPEAEDVAVDPDAEDVAVDPDEAGHADGDAADGAAADSPGASEGGAEGTPGEKPGTETPAPAPAVPSADLPAPWKDEDYRRLMTGELAEGYAALIPARRAEALKLPQATDRPESDSEVPLRYTTAYTTPPADGLIDPQHLLSTAEREDLLHVLSRVNADSLCRINVAVFKSSQKLSPELGIANLTLVTSEPCRYTLLISYPLGAPAELELGLHELRLSDEQRHAWLLAMRAEAARCGSGVEGIMAAVRSLAQSAAPVVAGLKPLEAEVSGKMPLIDLPMRQRADEEKQGTMDKMRAALSNPDNLPMFVAVGVFALAIVLYGLFRLIRNSHGVLIDSEPDRRLASPYGAGVSRLVRYLHGREDHDEAPPF